MTIFPSSFRRRFSNKVLSEYGSDEIPLSPFFSADFRLKTVYAPPPIFNVRCALKLLGGHETEDELLDRAILRSLMRASDAF